MVGLSANPALRHADANVPHSCLTWPRSHVTEERSNYSHAQAGRACPRASTTTSIRLSIFKHPLGSSDLKIHFYLLYYHETQRVRDTKLKPPNGQGFLLCSPSIRSLKEQSLPSKDALKDAKRRDHFRALRDRPDCTPRRGCSADLATSRLPGQHALQMDVTSSGKATDKGRLA